MPKKIIAIFLATFFLASCTTKTAEKIKLEKSGRAKAIETEADLWQVYKNTEAGFSLKFPHELALNENLRIETEAIESLGEQPLNFTTETAKNNQAALKLGEFGEDIDWPIDASKQVENLGELNAQDFLVLTRFEVCDVTFERKLIFYPNNQQVVLTLVGEREKIIAENSKFFTTNPENCGEMQIWDFEEQAEFFENLKNGNGSPAAQKWFDNVDAIAETIEFTGAKSPAFDSEILAGKWTSLDDPKSTIEFLDNKKIDFYNDTEISRNDFEILGDNTLMVESEGDILEYKINELSYENLVLIYLPRGNFLRYTK